MFKVKNKDNRTTNSVPFRIQILYILESVEINEKQEMSDFFQGTAECNQNILDLDSLYVEILSEIWRRLGWYRLKIWLGISRNLNKLTHLYFCNKSQTIVENRNE